MPSHHAGKRYDRRTRVFLAAKLLILDSLVVRREQIGVWGQHGNVRRASLGILEEAC